MYWIKTIIVFSTLIIGSFIMLKSLLEYDRFEEEYYDE